MMATGRRESLTDGVRNIMEVLRHLEIANEAFGCLPRSEAEGHLTGAEEQRFGLGILAAQRVVLVLLGLQYVFEEQIFEDGGGE